MDCFVICLQGNSDKALEYAERCPIALFDVDAADLSVDPNLLYWFALFFIII